MNCKNTVIFIIGLSLHVLACIPQTDFAKSVKKRSVDTNTDGGVTYGVVDTSGERVQVMEGGAGTAISGSEVSFPPGSLSISTEISIQEGTDLYADGSAEELGLGADDISSAGTPLFVDSKASVDPVQPFGITIPVSGSGNLALVAAERKLGILYKIIKYSEGGKYYLGIIPPDQVTKDNGKLNFATSFFGSFQPIYIFFDLAAPVEAATEKPIVTPIDKAGVAQGEIGALLNKLGSGKTYFYKVQLLDQSGQPIAESQQRSFITK